jgi:AmmeMemoRadiSam system protein A/AmmeMemoRadiSam system protein B
MSTRSLVFAGIAPHPPIMVPEVGGAAIAEVRDSIEGMKEFTRRVIESGAETIVLVSPHAPLDSRAFVAYRDAQLYGDLSQFRAPTTQVEAYLDDEMLEAISRAASIEGYEVRGIHGHEMDHGTIVPLYFLQRNGWRGKLVALGYSFLSNEDHVRFGECIRRALDDFGKPTAFVASGDLSHRLKPEAPAGFNRDAHLFDEEVIEAIKAGAPERIVGIDHDLRALAGECGYRSMLIACGVTKMQWPDCEVVNYEAPFGVGYLIAQLVREQHTPGEELSSEAEAGTGEQARGSGDQLLALARRAVETFVRDGQVIDVPRSSDPLLHERAGCFVSIKTRAGELRGCIGTIEPGKDELAEEVISNAVNSATRDPRFPPIKQSELPNLYFSVDVLSASEPAKLEELDPKVYGVIVEDESGRRRGLLLPDLPGVESAAQQVDIATRKAGIPPGVPLKLSRFLVRRYREVEGATGPD